MIKIKHISDSTEYPWIRQFPHNKPFFGNSLFIFDQPIDSYDVLVIFNGLTSPITTHIPVERTIFISAEPVNVKRYHPDFLNQFGLIITSDPDCQHNNFRLTQCCLPWHVGLWDDDEKIKTNPMTYDEFANFTPPKSKLVSVISSDKNFTPEHRVRLDFVEKLKAYFGNEIDYFGRGINSFEDKLDTLADYRYHIALENCFHHNYWTEKLSDPFLTQTYPLFYGCPNIHDYFPKESLTCIDINNPDTAIATIKKIIESDIAETAQPHLLNARNKVLNEHNIFGVIDKLANEMLDQKQLPKSTRQSREILPESHFVSSNNFIDTIKKICLKSPTLYSAAKKVKNNLDRISFV